MSLEARVQTLEDRQSEWDKILTGIEGTVALILKEQMEFRKQAEQRFEQIDKRFEQVEKRFDKIEEILVIVVNRLPK
ncbi:MAG: hypothetical protein ACR2PT_14470 [Endozoicomonas sp.]